MAGRRKKQMTSCMFSPTEATPPIFLQKTYAMIESSPSEIACWSECGHSFIIKHPDKFAKQMLPRYFRHSNFSSFVRQLNFYGFRKHRKEEIILSRNLDDPTKNYWEFYHEHFVRDRQELMCQIKRKSPSDGSDVEEQEIGALRDSVHQLQLQVWNLMSQMSDITNCMKVFFHDAHVRQQQMQMQLPLPTMPHMSWNRANPHGNTAMLPNLDNHRNDYMSSSLPKCNVLLPYARENYSEKYISLSEGVGLQTPASIYGQDRTIAGNISS